MSRAQTDRISPVTRPHKADAEDELLAKSPSNEHKMWGQVPA